MNGNNQLVSSERGKRCEDCRHCVDVLWMDKVVCLAYLEVRYPVAEGLCTEFSSKAQPDGLARGNAADESLKPVQPS